MLLLQLHGVGLFILHYCTVQRLKEYIRSSISLFLYYLLYSLLHYIFSVSVLLWAVGFCLNTKISKVRTWEICCILVSSVMSHTHTVHQSGFSKITIKIWWQYLGCSLVPDVYTSDLFSDSNRPDVVLFEEQSTNQSSGSRMGTPSFYIESSLHPCNIATENFL